MTGAIDHPPARIPFEAIRKIHRGPVHRIHYTVLIDGPVSAFPRYYWRQTPANDLDPFRW